MWFTILLVGIGLSLIYLYLVWNYNHWKKLGIISIKPVPVAGSFPGSFFQRRSLAYEIEEVFKKYRNIVPFVGYYSGRNPAVLLLDPKLIKQVLISDFRNFGENELGLTLDSESDPLLARNPFMLSGEEWKEKRSEITPAFTNNRIRALYPIVNDVCNKMNTFLKAELAKPKPDGFDAKELASKFTIDVVSSCIYGVDSKSFSLTEESEIRRMGTSIFSGSANLLFLFAISEVMPFITKIYKPPLVNREASNFFTNLMNQAIDIRKTMKIERDDYLNYLLQLQKKKNLKPIDMAAHSVSFFIDGFETSSVVISLILYNLGANERVQQKLRHEINKNIEKNGDITFEGLGEMEYLDQVFNETLRINPVAAVLTKKCTSDTIFTDYKDKPVEIKKGTVAMIPMYSIHRDAEHYTNPNEFYPERFNAEEGGVKKYRDAGVFIPFGDGPRICLGMRFAILQSKAAIVEIIRNFNVTVNKKTKEPLIYDPKEFLLVPSGGVWLDMKPI